MDACTSRGCCAGDSDYCTWSATSSEDDPELRRLASDSDSAGSSENVRIRDGHCPHCFDIFENVGYSVTNDEDSILLYHVTKWCIEMDWFCMKTVFSHSLTFRRSYENSHELVRSKQTVYDKGFCDQQLMNSVLLSELLHSPRLFLLLIAFQ